MIPYRATAPCDWAAILRLIQTEFAYMEGRIDPPSSMQRLTEADIAAKAESGEVWLVGSPPIACMFLTVKPDALYLGKLAVSVGQRGKGLARALVDVAEAPAKALGLAAVELETRAELLENHATFRALGFVETGRSAHPGYTQPTSISFRKAVQAR
ncbi:GNAT family N-acetyltransferase [Cypionkella sp.]|uniref:GNAT family N-acetyltransferase n=1 Tax=Cypionkella sp. TaxID=2811411 RepID=UPI002ABCA81F|nr:GNAT family N-acetyltransferase [Cypionkella sp.]MDZ4395890.1 GNAT family N-acetyltransferase [Cypionkella sp.]